MGMFDSVITKCPTCGQRMEFQSKAGERDLHEFNLSSVPPEIAIDLAENPIDCMNKCKCGQWVKFEPVGYTQIPCRVVAVNSEKECETRIEYECPSTRQDFGCSCGWRKD